VRESDTYLETWSFQCQKCLTIWQDTYEARHHEGFGDNVIAWRHHGTASMPPWAQATCTRCPGVRVTALPRTGRIPLQNRVVV
jgi:hypothetical protein